MNLACCRCDPSLFRELKPLLRARKAFPFRAHPVTFSASPPERTTQVCSLSLQLSVRLRLLTGRPRRFADIPLLPTSQTIDVETGLLLGWT